MQAGVHHQGVGNAELGQDVVFDPGRGRGREGQDRGVAQIGDGLGKAEVGGAEIVPPLGDAVGLVHHEEGHVHLGQ